MPRLPPTASSIQPARTVSGRWRLLDEIGSGATASVWRTLDLETGREVAAKVLGRHSGALLARFWREQEIRLRHPHLVTATGWAAEEDVVLMITDLVRGGTVQQLLDERGPLPDGVVTSVLVQTLAGLSAVHAGGLVHRDVKPDNLLLEATDDGSIHVRLADFGTALDTRAPRLTVAGAVGTDGYLAPDADMRPDPRHDLYAVGVLGVHLLTGRPPHPDLPLPASAVTPVLASLLRPEARERPGSAAAALEMLQRLGLHEEPGPWVRDRIGPGTSHEHRQGRIDPALVGAGLVVVACALLTLWSAVAIVAMLADLDFAWPFLDWVA